MHRTVHQPDGTRLLQKYIGPSKTFAEPGWDAAHNWEDAITLVPGAVALDFVQPTADLSCSALDDGTGIVINIAGGKSIVPPEQVAAFLPALQIEVDRAAANAKATAAKKAAQAAPVAAQAGHPAPVVGSGAPAVPAPPAGSQKPGG